MTGWGGRALDLLLPPLCLGCGARVQQQGTLCASCWRGLHFLSPPHCARCAFPFAYDLGPGALCAACAARPPAYDSARAALAYDDVSRPLVTRFKYGDRLEGIRLYARLMARAGEDILREADLLLPVPLHPFRLLKRRFNQAALLGHALSAASGVPVSTDMLRRTRRTPPQIGLSPAGRQRNVAHAFAVSPRLAPGLQGARLVLVDDVLTTGATAEACAKALRRAGAQRVDVLTLTRVVAERALPI